MALSKFLEKKLMTSNDNWKAEYENIFFNGWKSIGNRKWHG